MPFNFSRMFEFVVQERYLLNILDLKQSRQELPYSIPKGLAKIWLANKSSL